MRDPRTLQEFLAGAWVDATVFSLRPDYRAVLLAVDGLVPGVAIGRRRLAATPPLTEGN